MSTKLKLITRIINKSSWSLVYSRKCSSGNPVKTALYDFHANNSGKIVNFGGYLLPLHYSNLSISSSHTHTRENSSVFDVSHMLQTKIHGKDRIELIEQLTTADVQNLPPNKAALTVFTDEKGGILDDLIVTNCSDGYLYVVSNAGRRQFDMKHLLDTERRMKAEGKDVTLEFLDPSDVSLIAIQGPTSVHALQEICSVPIKELPFMSSTIAEIGGIAGCRVNRCGYTGEDGFEISVPSSSVVSLVSLLLESKVALVKLAGLAARDTLRIEAGLCLYGVDIDTNISPVEASLAWLIPKSRRGRKDFPGADVICRQLKEGVSRKRIGLVFDGGASARYGYKLLDVDGNQVGSVTSGIPSISRGCNIAMGYSSLPHVHKPGTKLQIEVRGKKTNATVVKMPFVPTNYYTS